MSRTSNQRGFTLIELMAVVAIMAVLAGLAAQSYNYAKIEAGHATVRKWVRDALTDLENSLFDEQNPPPAVPLTVQSQAGNFTDANVAELLPNLSVPGQTTIRVYHDPTCVSSGCFNSLIQANHCQGREYSLLTRFGDGIYIYEDNRPEVGCP